MRRCVAFVLFCAVFTLAGCGFHPLKSATQTSSDITVTAQNGASTVREGSSQQFSATSSSGAAGFSWAVNGVTGGTSATGTIDASGLYTAPAVGTALSNPNTVTITAAAGGKTSNGVPLSVLYPIPTVTSTDLAQLPVGVATTLNVTGTNFVNGAQVLLGGTAFPTTFVDTTHLTAQVTAASAGTVNVNVKNPDPGSSTATVQLSVNAIVTPVISGVAAKNFLSGALVTAYAVDPATDTDGAVLGTATTAADGSFSLHLVDVPTGPVRLKATGGSFVDDTDVSKTVQNTIELNTLLDSVTADISGVAVTVLTDMVNSITDGLFSGAATNANLVQRSGAGGFFHNLASSHGQGQVTVKGLYKLKKNPEDTPPSNDGSDEDGLAVTIISGSMYQCGVNSAGASGVTPGAWIKALSQDFSDGKFDGMYKDSSGTSHQVMLQTDSGQVPLSSSAGTTDFLNCMNQFTQGTNTVLTQNNVDQTTINQTTGNIASGVISSPVSPSTGLNSGGSSSVATMMINGKQYLFVAARNEGVVVIDITDPTSKTPPTKVWTNLANIVLAGFSSTYGSSNVGLVVPVLGNSTHNQLLIFSYSFGKIGIINADKLVSGTPTVDDADETALAASGLVDFSGNVADGGYTFGALLDAARKGVWIYVYSGNSPGYKFFDLTTNQVTGGYPQDSPYYETENLGGDTASNIIFGGNYAGVQLIDLAGGISYDLDQTFYYNNFSSLDQTAMDTAYDVALGMSECKSTIGIFDVSKAVYTAPTTPGGPGSWVPGSGGFIAYPFVDDYCLTMANVDSSSHLAMMGVEGGTFVYVARIDNPAAPANGTWAGFSDLAHFNAYNSSVYGYYGTGFSGAAGDPHSIGTATAISNGKAYGYMLSGDQQHLLVVDMDLFLTLPRDTGGSDPKLILGDPAASNAMWVWSW